MCRESNVKEQITFSRSFAKPVTARNEMERVLSVYTQRGAGRFQKQNSVTKTMSLFASTSPSAEQPNEHASVGVVFPVATDDSVEMVRAAIAAFGPRVRECAPYVCAGVTLARTSGCCWQSSGVLG